MKTFRAYIKEMAVKWVPLKKVSRSDFCHRDLMGCSHNDHSAETHDEYIKGMVKSLQKGKRLPAVHLVRKKGGFSTIDGSHRHEANQIVGKKKINARVWKSATDYFGGGKEEK